MSDTPVTKLIEVKPMKWRERVWQTVNGAAWYCDCGAAGLNHYSMEMARQEADRHKCQVGSGDTR